MKSMMMKMGALQLAAIAAAMEAATLDKTPRPRMDVSKPATLSSRRKRRRALAKHSRRQNRK